MIREWLDGRRVRVTAHFAESRDDDGGKIPLLFVNVTNLGRRDIEITHVWVASSPPVYFDNNESRPLPRRLSDQGSWSTWVQLGEIPKGIVLKENMARVRLSTGTILGAFKENTVPPMGTVAG